jgi:hypothetical protein
VVRPDFVPEQFGRHEDFCCDGVPAAGARCHEIGETQAILETLDKQMRNVSRVFGQLYEEQNIHVISPELSYLAYW